ncbi:hypothetical protein TNIN_110461 [Trichonephila inaurata madagascariensis]|uniref:Uncharacterized protein n=1 Tax=Trichonephila inaurata madagascariensis TaxID=2747483 RepID=A0A8X6WP67_9ARAC|nr:hypothetical protein TNIN_110461 [Trichonephila inaurata madagascariensis]
MNGLRITPLQTLDSCSLHGQFLVAQIYFSSAGSPTCASSPRSLNTTLLLLVRWWLRLQRPLESGLRGKSHTYIHSFRGIIAAQPVW